MSATFTAPVVVRAGSTDPDAPLVVLLHGRGADERSIIGLASAVLPTGAAYAAVRAPIAEGGGYAWFANRGIGRPVAESLAQTMAWFRAWLDAEAAPGRPVLLVGFSGGAAFAGGLLLSDPQRYAGGAILYGTLPFEAGVPVEPARLVGVPTFVAQGEQDHVIPRELLDRTWDYLLAESGSPTVARRDPGGHGLTNATAQRLAEWVAQRLTWVLSRHDDTLGGGRVEAWPTSPALPDGRLPARRGEGPQVSWTIPQQQESQIAPTDLQRRLLEHASSLADVTVAPSMISVPGAHGLTLAGDVANRDAFLVPEVGEFAHVHPGHDASMHLALPVHLAAEVVRQGWGRPHMWAGVRLSPGFVMVYGPRDEEELAVVETILDASHAAAVAGLVRAPITPAGSAPGRP